MSYFVDFQLRNTDRCPFVIQPETYFITQRTFASDEFGPFGIRPTAGTNWAPAEEPDRLPASYRRTHGVTYFHGW
jgi:hypothetical protein